MKGLLSDLYPSTCLGRPQPA